MRSSRRHSGGSDDARAALISSDSEAGEAGTARASPSRAASYDSLARGTDDDDDGAAADPLLTSAGGTAERRERLGARTLFVCLFTTIGGFVFGFDTGVIGGVIEMNGFRDSMSLPRKQAGEEDDADTADKLGWVVAILSFGCLVGAVVSGVQADRFGRVSTTCWGGLTTTVGGIVQATSTSLTAILVGRFVCGVGIGTLSSIVPLYNAEVAPKALRGFLVALQQLAITFGIMVAFLANLGTAAAHSGWRVSLWLQVVASGALLLGSPFLPETPRWLLSRGRTAAAVAALERVRPHLAGDEAKALIADIKRSIDEECADATWAGLLTWPKRYRLVLGMGIMVGSQLTGINAIIYYAPTIFGLVGIEPLTATAVVGVVNFVSTFPGLYGLDRFGRKALLVSGSFLMFLSFLAIVILLETDNAGIAVAVLVTFYTSCFAWSWGPSGWVYISEIFPTAGRGKAVGAASASNWAISTVLAWSTPLMLREKSGLGLTGTFIFYATFCLTNALFVLFFCAETKGRSLEEVSRLFAAPLSPLAVGDFRSTFRRAPPKRTVLVETRSAAFSMGAPDVGALVDAVEA